MKNEIKYVKCDGLWYPITENMIDQRSPGKVSKIKVRQHLAERNLYTGSNFSPKFV
jgi:hypothetical protein